MKLFQTAIFLIVFTPQANAFSFGADVAVLAQILAKSVMQLEQLRQILQSGSDQLNLIRDVNEGLDRTVRLIRLVDPKFDPGVYRDFKDIGRAVREIEEIYGIVTKGPDQRAQRRMDRVIAEALTNNSSVYDYAKTTEDFGERLHSRSQGASPKSAQRLSAQSLGVVVGQMSQSLRGQATANKLQAQSMIDQNRKNKLQTKQVQNASSDLSESFRKFKPRFELPKL